MIEFLAFIGAIAVLWFLWRGPTTIENIPERTVRWRWLLVGQEFGVESERAAREIAHKWGESARVARIEYENGRAVKVELEP